MDDFHAAGKQNGHDARRKADRHHVAADDLGQFDLGHGTPCGGKANKGQNEFLHIGQVSISRKFTFFPATGNTPRA